MTKIVRVFTLLSILIITMVIYFPSDSIKAEGVMLKDVNLIELKRSDINYEQRIEILNDFIEKVNEKEMRLEALKRQLNNNNIARQLDEINQEIEELEIEVKYIHENLEAITGLIKVETFSDQQDYSVQSDGAVNFKGNLYYDSLFTNKYVMWSEFNWRNTAFFNQISGTGSVGGYEGFWLRLANKGIKISSTSAQIFDYQDGQSQSVQFYQNVSDYGRAWRWQDVVTSYSLGGRNYNSQSGRFTIYFDWVSPPHSGAQLRYYAGLAHTWNQTSINSIGIGANSVSVGWTTNSNSWSDEREWWYTH